MSELHWQAVRAEAIELFDGQVPRAEDEAEIIEHFRSSPKRVERTIRDIAAALARGEIRYAWSAMRARLERGARPVADVTVETGRSRDAAAARGEQWIHAAGKHFDSEDELLDELFGVHGRLREWRDDEALRERMRVAWQRARPEGELIEAQALTRAEQWKLTRLAAKTRPQAPKVELEEAAA